VVSAEAPSGGISADPAFAMRAEVKESDRLQSRDNNNFHDDP
jgi:hypothetical protein